MKSVSPLPDARMMKFACYSSLAAVLLLSGCNSKTKATPENFTQAINNYYLDRSECLFPDIRFPYATSDPEVTKQMNTLVKSHLLESSYESSVKTTRYTVSTVGNRFAPRFCYGHRSVTTIDNFTPPQKGPSGFPETEITYHYTLKDVPVWAQSPDIGTAYPKMSRAVSDGGTDKISLAQTLAGWQVPER
ncbi:hypothetical protein [Edaphobacter albus]|uniref:hypothetical protein n=1 Tax=Edaphobacter sp. 4G125 TaxID=2763071 RepID=UPI00164541EA|nr:hypothetical protein [Edaphobacter sp. 4G125]QNI36018.1 hypothetical protein H7846_13555 [Edaphobacter sp. 4G125]